MNDKNFLLCADDYGMNDKVNAAIIELIQKNRLSAVSCMTNTPHWNLAAQALQPFQSNIKIGLHFNLPIPSLGLFIAQSYAKMIPREKIKHALANQYHAFLEQMGRKPDFIDGHQHIHQLPVIRHIVIDFYLEHYPNFDGFIRSTRNSQSPLKAKLINALGGRRLKKLLTQHHIPHNSDFSGIYHFSTSTDYTHHLQQFINQIHDGGLIMCHPGHWDSNEPFRWHEFNALINATAPGDRPQKVTRIPT